MHFPIFLCTARRILPGCLFALSLGTAEYSAHQIILQVTHTESFGDNLPLSFFNVQLTCNHFNCQLTITSHYLPYPLDIDLCLVCWRLSTPGVIFHLLATLFEHFAPLKNTCVRHWIISIYLLKHSKCLWQRFPQMKQNFKYIRSSVLIAKQPVKMCKKKYVKKCNGCRKLRL